MLIICGITFDSNMQNQWLSNMLTFLNIETDSTVNNDTANTTQPNNCGHTMDDTFPVQNRSLYDIVTKCKLCETGLMQQVFYWQKTVFLRDSGTLIDNLLNNKDCVLVAYRSFLCVKERIKGREVCMCVCVGGEGFKWS